MVDKTTKVFVYGTLKEGRPLDRANFKALRTNVEEATIAGSIFSLGPYPTIQLDDGGEVHGEVHTFKTSDFAAVLQTMDYIEGYDKDNPTKGLYNRHLVEATLKDSGEKVTAVAYEINRLPSGAKRLDDGVWEPGK